MKLVTFRIDRYRNLIIQFPIFVQPYMQQPLTLYQLETVPIDTSFFLCIFKVLKSVKFQSMIRF